MVEQNKDKFYKMKFLNKFFLRSDFEKPWINYLKTRNIETETNDPIFPDKYDVKIIY